MIRYYRCLACNGVYGDVDEHGRPYHHKCPPLIDPKTQQLRGDLRDESIDVGRFGRPTGIKSAGAGVRPIDASSPADPSWITELYERQK